MKEKATRIAASVLEYEHSGEYHPNPFINDQLRSVFFTYCKTANLHSSRGDWKEAAKWRSWAAEMLWRHGLYI